MVITESQAAQLAAIGQYNAYLAERLAQGPAQHVLFRGRQVFVVFGWTFDRATGMTFGGAPQVDPRSGRLGHWTYYEDARGNITSERVVSD